VSGSSRRLLGTLAATLVGGCATAADEPSTGSTAGAGVIEVIALDNSFQPVTIEVVAGTTVRWANRGRNDHNVLSVDGSWGAPTEDFRPGDAYDFVFADSGTFAYYCSIHGTKDAGMVGEILVTP
jgi:plastocyanin